MQQTPKPYLSYSQLSSLEYSDERYIKSYIWGQKDEENEYLKLGKRLHLALQRRENKEDEWIEKIKKQIPKYPKREFEIKANLKDIPLYGILDGYDSNKSIRFADYKTGLKPNLGKWQDQINFYSLIFWQNNKKLPDEIKIYWAQTCHNPQDQLIFTGAVKEYEIKPKITDIIMIGSRIITGWEKIKELVQNQRSMFGKLPFDI